MLTFENMGLTLHKDKDMEFFRTFPREILIRILIEILIGIATLYKLKSFVLESNYYNKQTDSN